MSNKNEYLDCQTNIYQDTNFLKQIISKINTKIETATSDDFQTAINLLKKYSELPDYLHKEQTNSIFINDLYEYYIYLLNRYNMNLTS